jgi:hypothetical protein
MYLASSQLDGGFAAQEGVRFMVSNHRHLGSSFKVVVPLDECLDHSQQLLFSRGVVALMLVHPVAVVSYGLASLLQNSTTTITRGITNHIKT